MFYRQGFSFIDGIGLLDHRSLVQLRRLFLGVSTLGRLDTYFYGLLHSSGSLLSMFYRQGFSFIDGNVVLDHRSLVQLCRPLWVGDIHCLFY